MSERNEHSPTGANDADPPSDHHDEMTAHASTPAPGGTAAADEYDLTESDQDTAGSMGVSSEREGPTGPGQHGTSGVRPVGPPAEGELADAPPEQSPGGPETNSYGLPPKAGYSSTDPRSHGDEPSRPRHERELDRQPDDD